MHEVRIESEYPTDQGTNAVDNHEKESESESVDNHEKESESESDEEDRTVGEVTGYETEFANSDEYPSPESSDEEGENRVRRSFPVFNPNTQFDSIDLVKGMKFANRDQLKQALTLFAVAKGYQLRFTRNCKTQFLAVCVDGCPFRCWASPMQMENSWQIKSLNLNHKCSRAVRVKLANARWLSKMYEKKLKNDPNWKLKSFKSEVREKYRLEVSILQCFRAKKIALGEMEQSLIEHYGKLWDYGGEILRSNPGSTVQFKTNRINSNGPACFLRMYVCLDALKKGWVAGRRPVIGIDGCFLKSFCKGDLLAAVGRDGNNHIYPIVWAVVEVESTDSWEWFIDLLKDDLNLTKGVGLTILSDQQKGLLNAVERLPPMAEHRNCARHIYANLRKRWSGTELKSKFWEAVKVGTAEEFEKKMDELRKINRDAADYLLKQNPTSWARAFFAGHPTCDAVKNNMCETFNGFILKAREKPIIYMLEEIRQNLMVRMHKKREQAQKLEGKLCPRAVDKLEISKEQSRYWETTFNGAKEFEVKNGHNGYVVDFGEQKCSCRLWEVSRIPCPHAVSAIYYMKQEPEDYVSEWHHVELCKKAYQYFLRPLNGESQWVKSPFVKMLPPVARRMPGRPKKARNKEVHEDPNGRKNPNEMSRKGRQMKCKNCGTYGHNKRGCKQPPNPATSGAGTSRSNVRKPTKMQVKKPKRVVSEGAGPSTAPPTIPSTAAVRNKESVPTIPSTAIPTIPSTAPHTIPARRTVRNNERVPHGYGVYISENTGNTFVRMSGNSGASYRSDQTPTFVRMYAAAASAAAMRNQSTKEPVQVQQPAAAASPADLGSHSRSSRTSTKEAAALGSQSTSSIANNTRSKTPTKDSIANNTRSKTPTKRQKTLGLRFRG